MVDGKNVTTDWIESVFDNFECIRKDKELLGYIVGNVLYVSYEGNTITWEIIDGKNRQFAYDVLLHHLESLETDEGNIYSEVVDCFRSNKTYAIIQRFYFKES